MELLTVALQTFISHLGTAAKDVSTQDGESTCKQDANGVDAMHFGDAKKVLDIIDFEGDPFRTDACLRCVGTPRRSFRFSTATVLSKCKRDATGRDVV